MLAMKKKLYTAISIILVSLNTQALTQTEFIKKLIHSPGYQKISLQLDRSKQQKEIYNSAQDWRIGVNSSYTSQTLQDNLLNPSNLENTYNISPRISRPIFATGGQLSLAYEWNKNNFANRANTDYHNSTIEVSYSQPLLKNYLGIVDRLDIDLSQFDIYISKLKITEQQQSYIANQLRLFFDWARYQEQLILSKKQLNLAKELLDKVTKKFNNSVVEEVDVLSQKELVLTRQQAVLNLEQLLFSSREKIAKLLNDEEINEQFAEFDFDQTLVLPNDKQIENSALFQILKLSIAKSKRNIETLKNQRKAQLNLDLTAKAQGQNADYQQTLNHTSPEYTLALNYEYPLGNRGAKASLSQEYSLLNEQQLNYQQQLQAETANLINVKRNINFLKQQFQLSTERLKNAKKRSKQQQTRYEFAQIDISLVIDALNEEQRIEQEKLDYQAEYQNAYYDYLRILNLIKMD